VVKDITPAALMAKLNVMRDCVLVIDDKNVTRTGAKELSKLIHALFDGQPQETTKTERHVRSSVMVSTNHPPPSPETAQGRRVLPLHFGKAAGRPTASAEATCNLNKLRDLTYHSLSAFFAGIHFDLAQVDRVQRERTNDENAIHTDLKSWYACWFYFTKEYARLVLNMEEEDVWKHFQSDILKKQVQGKNQQASAVAAKKFDGPFQVQAEAKVASTNQWLPLSLHVIVDGAQWYWLQCELMQQEDTFSMVSEVKKKSRDNVSALQGVGIETLEEKDMRERLAGKDILAHKGLKPKLMTVDGKQWEAFLRIPPEEEARLKLAIEEARLPQ